MQVLNEAGGTINGNPASKEEIRLAMERDNLLERAANLQNINATAKLYNYLSSQPQTGDTEKVTSAVGEQLETNIGNTVVNILGALGIEKTNPFYENYFTEYCAIVSQLALRR